MEDTKKELIEQLRKEVELLESWIVTTKSGGWSTHLVEPMTKRLMELKSFLYDIQMRSRTIYR